MYVRDYMSTDPVIIGPNDAVGDALELLKDHSIRRLPVVSKGKLIGLVTNTDLMKASPSPVTSLSIHEINYLYPKIKIKDIMTSDVITIGPDEAIEEAAVLMREKKLGTLVVVDRNNLVGIITESDLFKAFIDVFNFDRPGIKVVVSFEDKIGELGKLTSLISSMDILIISLIITYSKDGKAVITMRLKTDQKDPVVKELEKNGYAVIG
ncbi:MAG: CBS and ACT domain-containing protein [Bacillota bacterium]